MEACLSRLHFCFGFLPGRCRWKCRILLFYCCEDGFQTLFDVFSVKEEAVKVAHPGGQQRDFFHFFFGNVACADRAAGVGEKDVEVASVVADVQDWGVFWNVFFSDHGDFGSCDP